MRTLIPVPLVMALLGCGEIPSETRAQMLGDGAGYRVTEARILDPHFYADPLFVGCTDVTDHAPAGKKSANEQLVEAIQTDDDGDGLLDFAVVLDAPPENGSESPRLEILRGDCPEDDADFCFYDPTVEPDETPATLREGEPCYQPDDELVSTAEYLPPVRAVESPCFDAEPVDFEVDLGDDPFLLRDARFAASYEDDGTLDGMLVGFLTLGEARRVEVKRTPLAEYLPGGDDVCAEHDDSDTGAGDRTGWWMHIDFSAEPVELAERTPEEPSGGCSTTPPAPALVWLVVAFSSWWSAVRRRRG